MDEQHLAGPQARLARDGVVGGDERLGDGRRLTLVEDLRHPCDAAFVHRDAIRQAAAADEAEHAVARRPGGDARPAALDGARDLEPGNVRRRARGRRVAARSLLEVGRVEAGEADAHEHVLIPGDGVRPLLEAHDLVAAGTREDEGPQGSISRSARKLRSSRSRWSSTSALLSRPSTVRKNSRPPSPRASAAVSAARSATPSPG